MPLLRRFGRRINAAYWDLRYFFANIPKLIAFKYKIKKLGVSEKYIAEAFSYLCQLDLTRVVNAGPRIRLDAAGNFVHIWRMPDNADYVRGGFVEDEITITDNDKGQIIVHRWSKEEQQGMTDGYQFQTHWEEIYRTGRLIKDIAFVEYLKELYGDGKYKPDLPAGEGGFGY